MVTVQQDVQQTVPPVNIKIPAVFVQVPISLIQPHVKSVEIRTVKPAHQQMFVQLVRIIIF